MHRTQSPAISQTYCGVRNGVACESCISLWTFLANLTWGSVGNSVVPRYQRAHRIQIQSSRHQATASSWRYVRVHVQYHAQRVLRASMACLLCSMCIKMTPYWSLLDRRRTFHSTSLPVSTSNPNPIFTTSSDGFSTIMPLLCDKPENWSVAPRNESS